jgi:hypothetical protein
VYNSNRAPFGLNMHAAWFFTPAYLRAMDTFIQRLLQHRDVYIVTAKQVLDWMRSPVKVSIKGWFKQDILNTLNTVRNMT